LTPILAQGFLGIEHFTPPWDVFYLPLFNLLVFLNEIPFFDFALAIIVFTIIIRTILAPLFIRQIRSQKEMQRMQPLIREVQRKHKGNRQKVSEETMALYREHGVNPAAGCLPVLIQLPILFALYQALIRASGVVNFNPSSDAQRTTLNEWVETAGLERLANNNYGIPADGPCNAPPDFASLVPLNCQLIEPIKLDAPVDTTVGWLLGLDLARIDNVFSIALFGGFALSLLAVVAAVLQFVQVKMTSPRPNPEDPTSSMTSTMTYTFPVLTIIWGGIFPSGLILYWIVYTAYLVVQQYLIMGWGNLFPLFGWQPRWAPATDGTVRGPALPRSPRTDDARAEDPGPTSTPAPATSGGGRASARPANRRQGGNKRRGRKR
jgi:YidC/Oxa1 family membrane protein insertase